MSDERETPAHILRRWADEGCNSCELCEELMNTGNGDCGGDCAAWRRMLADMAEEEVEKAREDGVAACFAGMSAERGWPEREPFELVDEYIARCFEPRFAVIEGRAAMPGDELWFGDEKVTVVSVANGTHVLTDHTVTGEDGNEIVYPFEPCELTWERPDNMERIREDALNDVVDYWGCEDAPCQRCPAKVGGKTPAERYGVGSCQTAVRFDLISRTEEVCGR